MAILALTASVHARAFGNPFLFFDDPQNVLDNPSIRALTLPHLKIYFTTPLLGMYSPLVYLSFAVDYAIGGFDPRAYHATNLALHLTNVAARRRHHPAADEPRDERRARRASSSACTRSTSRPSHPFP